MILSALILIWIWILINLNCNIDDLKNNIDQYNTHFNCNHCNMILSDLQLILIVILINIILIWMLILLIFKSWLLSVGHFILLLLLLMLYFDWSEPEMISIGYLKVSVLPHFESKHFAFRVLIGISTLLTAQVIFLFEFFSPFYLDF